MNAAGIGTSRDRDEERHGAAGVAVAAGCGESVAGPVNAAGDGPTAARARISGVTLVNPAPGEIRARAAAPLVAPR